MKYAENEEDIEKLKQLSKTLHHDEFKKIRNTFFRSNDVHVEIMDPIYSIHIPGDYNEVVYLLDLFDDN